MEKASHARRYQADTPAVPLPPDTCASAPEQIRTRLRAYTLTYVWLIKRLEERGLYTTRPEMSGIVSGTRTGPKVDTILQASLELLDEYAERMGA